MQSGLKPSSHVRLSPTATIGSTVVLNNNNFYTNLHVDTSGRMQWWAHQGPQQSPWPSMPPHAEKQCWKCVSLWWSCKLVTTQARAYQNFLYYRALVLLCTFKNNLNLQPFRRQGKARMDVLDIHLGIPGTKEECDMAFSKWPKNKNFKSWRRTTLNYGWPDLTNELECTPWLEAVRQKKDSKGNKKSGNDCIYILENLQCYIDDQHSVCTWLRFYWHPCILAGPICWHWWNNIVARPKESEHLAHNKCTTRRHTTLSPTLELTPRWTGHKKPTNTSTFFDQTRLGSRHC